MTNEETLTMLAEMSRIDYDRTREHWANELGVRLKTLDEEVKGRRKLTDTETQTSILEEDLEPWPDEVAGVQLLDEIRATLTRYIVMPEHSCTALALWVIFTYCFDTFYSCPLILITSPIKRCGKTLCLSLLRRLVHRAIPASSISEASLFRTVEKWSPTLLIDEADTFLANNDALRGLINAGFNRDLAFVIRTVEVGGDYIPQKFCTWGPKAIAQIGQPAQTIVDRGISVPMDRKPANIKVARLRGRDSFIEIRQKCLTWAIAHQARLAEAEPEPFATDNDRALDKWEPLLAIADAVGGEWPELARRAAETLSNEEDNDGYKAQLLADIRTAFEESGSPDWLSSADLIRALTAMEERPWSTWGRTGKPMTQNGLARQLKPFKATPGQYKERGEKHRGYARKQLEEVWVRYLPPSQAVPPVPTSIGAGFSDFQSGTHEQAVPLQKVLNAALDKGSTTGTGSHRGNGGITPRLAKMVKEAAAHFNAASGSNLTAEALAAQVDFDDPEQMMLEWLLLYCRNVWESNERKK